MNNNGLIFETKDTDSYMYKLEEIANNNSDEFKAIDLDKQIPFIDTYNSHNGYFITYAIDIPKCWVKSSNNIIDLIKGPYRKYLVEYMNLSKMDCSNILGKLICNMGVNSFDNYLTHEPFLIELGVLPGIMSENFRIDIVQKALFSLVNELGCLELILKSEEIDGNLLNLVLDGNNIINDTSISLTGENGNKNTYDGYSISIDMNILDFTKSLDDFIEIYYDTITKANIDWLTSSNND